MSRPKCLNRQGLANYENPTGRLSQLRNVGFNTLLHDSSKTTMYFAASVRPSRISPTVNFGLCLKPHDNLMDFPWVS
jgi:hypothetical protein